MVDALQLSLLALVVVLSLADIVRLRKKEARKTGYGGWIRQLAKRRGLVVALLACATFLGCLLVAQVIHEPIPRVPDEFSYLLMADTFAHGHLANPTPPLPEFFDTLHVLVHPAYASKYFPAQGVFLALGQKLAHHPSVGLWLSSSLACAATCWMLQAWAGPVWGLVGGVLMMVQWGVFSYWSQSYWGGMVAALGGALCLGALRRLWDHLSWSSALCFALGSVILVNSRPLEGALAVGVATIATLCRAWKQRRRPTPVFWRRVVIPATGLLLLGAALTMVYNHAVTGSAWTSPYLEHERQYQQTPPFIFLPMHPDIGYSNPVMAGFYGDVEGYRYEYKRHLFPCSTATVLADWWSFYCGVLLSLPLVIPVLLRPGWTRYVQLAVLAGLIALTAISHTNNVGLRSLMDLLVLVQVVLLWRVFAGFWQRLAISTAVLLLVVGFVSKWWFPHYSAPVAGLLWFLQLDGLRRLWHWRSETVAAPVAPPNRGRRRSVNGPKPGNGFRLGIGLRNLVVLFPIICALSLAGRVIERKNSIGPLDELPDWGTLIDIKGDWSITRTTVQAWLGKQAGPQLVFVQYGSDHSFAAEWVYNEPDLEQAKIVWAHDMGAEHNRLLLQQMPERTPWLLQADLPNPVLSAYKEAGQSLSPAPQPTAMPGPGAPASGKVIAVSTQRR
jgi:hypothetical protein